MTPEERLREMEQENTVLREQLSQRDELIEQLQQRLHLLEERLSKNSHNSHLPPSSDRFVRQPKSLRKKSGKKPGGQEGHPGKTLMWSEIPDEVIVHPVTCCEHCQSDLQAVPPVQIERRQVVDVPAPRLLVHEHHAERKQCPACHQITAAPFPAEVDARVQYGMRLGAMAVYLVLHQDETGLYVKGERHWIHVACTAQLTHYAVHPKRGKDALDAIGILPRFQGTSVHDGWRSYFRYACSHALCLVHVLRELTFLAEEQGLVWAADLKALLLDMKEATDEARKLGLARLHPLEVEDWQAQFVALVAHADATTPTAQAPPGKKGRAKQSAARNLLSRLIGDQQAVLAFLHRLVVPFDNNQAERDVRMVKVQQKVSGSFRSEAGATAFYRIRGYLSTLRKQGLDLLASLEATLRGHPILPSFQTT